MKMIFYHKSFSYTKVVRGNFVPRVGDEVDMWHRPFPRVTNVIAFPTAELLKEFDGAEDVDAIISVE